MSHTDGKPLTLKEQVAALEAQNIKLKRDLHGCLKILRALIKLCEAWAYGPAFKKAGVMWPDNNCNAPSYVEARKWLKTYDQEND